MRCNDVIIDLVKFGLDKGVFITVFERNGDGDVIGKRKYPVSAVFSHAEQCDIYVEESQKIPSSGLR